MTQRSPKPTEINASISTNESERLAALYRYNVLDTPPETAFDRITSLAAQLFKMPTVLVSLVDESRAWFKSCYGFDLPEVPRDATLCSFALLYNKILVVPDARLDQRFACNPFVQREPGVRFYAGAPLFTQDGFNLGTLCLLDSQPREMLSLEQQGILTDLASIVIDELELRLAAQRMARQEAIVQASNQRLKLLSETANDLLLAEDPRAFLARLFEKVSMHLGLEVYFNYLFNSEQQCLHLHTYGGISEEIVKSAAVLELGQGVCGYAVQHRQPAVVENALSTDHPLAIPVQSIGLRAYASHPLIVGDRVLGTLGLGTRQRDRFTHDELDLMQAVANQVAAALERSRLVTEIKARAEVLAQSNQIKDEFLAVLSHELRTPLNPILGWSKLLQRGNLDAAKTTTAIATIERNAQLQVQLIDDLLDISRILSGKMSLAATPVDLSTVVSAALETVQLAAEAKSIRIQTDISPILGVIIGDAGRLQQVVWNLLSNAVKFTPQEGQVRIALSQAEHYAQIQVIDTGKGVRSDFLPYVFEHFRQEDGATTRKFGGLGLGLAIVRQIVEMHGGTVIVASLGEGQGATFTVQLPLAPRLTAAPLLDPLPGGECDLSGVHILIVDDETDSREFVAFVLEQAKAIVTATASGVEALQAIAQSLPNLIVSDLGMPEMDGYMLMQQIRALPPQQGGQIPTIALTAYAGELDQQQALKAGFQQHLPKPIEPDQLVRAVVTLIGNSK